MILQSLQNASLWISNVSCVDCDKLILYVHCMQNAFWLYMPTTKTMPLFCRSFMVIWGWTIIESIRLYVFHQIRWWNGDGTMLPNVSLIAEISSWCLRFKHFNDVIMSAMACQITSLTIVYSRFYASLADVKGIHRWPMHSPHKGPVERKMFPFDDCMKTPTRIDTSMVIFSVRKYIQ